MKHVRRVAVGLLLILSVTAAPLRGQKLGTIDFPTSATADAQAAFVRGVLFMHSFEYEDAGKAFRVAQAAQPDFAMAYWGEAMSYNHPVWQRQDAAAARAALARAQVLASSLRPEVFAASLSPETKEDWNKYFDWLAESELF